MESAKVLISVLLTFWATDLGGAILGGDFFLDHSLHDRPLTTAGSLAQDACCDLYVVSALGQFDYAAGVYVRDGGKEEVGGYLVRADKYPAETWNQMWIRMFMMLRLR